MATKIAEDYSCIQYADPHQQKLYTKFDSESLLGTPEGVDHFIQWTTFFRRNLHRFAIDYLEIRLHIYQVLILYLMGVCRFIVIIASRAAAKSWTIALFAVCQAILYPNSEIVLASAKSLY